MITLLWHLLIIGLCVRSAICNAFILYITRVRSNRSRAPQTNPPDYVKFAVILPVYDEEQSVSSAIDHLTSLISSDTILCIVGNAKERDRFGNNTTLDAAASASTNKHNVTVLEYPSLNGRRPDQINYAINSVKSDPEITWILMVDVDSRLSTTGLSDILSAVRVGHTIIHQPALFLGNFASLSFAQRGHAIYQSRWTLAHEMRRILTHNYTGCFISHVVGHGLCIHLGTLNDLGGLPTDTVLEDLHLGFYAAALMRRIHVIRSFEIGDCPSSWRGGIEQQFRWASGAQQYPLFYRHFLRRFPDGQRTVMLRALTGC